MKVFKLRTRILRKTSRRFRKFWNKIRKKCSKIRKKFLKIRNLIILINTSIVPAQAVQAIGLPIIFPSTPSIIRNVHSNADGREKKLAIAQIVSTNRDTIVFSKKQVKQIDEFYEIFTKWEDNSMSTEEVIGKLRGGDMKSLLKFASDAYGTIKTMDSESLLKLASGAYEMLETIERTSGIDTETALKLFIESITNKKVDPTFFTAVKIARFASKMKKVEAFVPLYPHLDALAKGRSSKDFESFFEHFDDKEFDGLKNLKKRTGLPKGLVDRYLSQKNVTLGVEQIQAKFKHTAKMGFKWNYNPKNADTLVLSGIFRRVGKVIHFFNKETHINLMVFENNRTFISAWNLTEKQEQHLMNDGIL